MGDHIQYDIPECNNISNLIRSLGVTLPPEIGFYKLNLFYPQTKTFEYLLVFRGACSTHIRRALTQIFANRSAGEEDVLIEWTKDCAKDAIQASEPPNYDDMMATARFCLLPRGDRRWTYRLMDALARGCIPVFVADGLSLPFEQLIPWDKISIRIPQRLVDLGLTDSSMAAEVKGIIISQLRRFSDEFIMKVQSRISAIFTEYFLTEEKRALATLHCVWRVFENRNALSFRNFPIKDAFTCDPNLNATLRAVD
jgi:hypothetical protein